MPGSQNISSHLKPQGNLELFLLKLRFQEGMLVGVEGNEPLLLDDPKSAWVVYSGIINVFAIQTQNRETTSARIHIFQGGVGQLLLGTDTSAQGGFKLLVTGTPDTRLLKYDKARLQALAAELEYQDLIAGMLEDWAKGLTNGIPSEIVPKDCILLRAGDTVDLSPSAITTPKQGPLWVQPLEGNATYMGLPELQWSNTGHFMPVADEGWLRAVDTARLRALNTIAYIEQDPAWSGLEDFQRLVLRATAVSQQNLEATERDRLKARAEANARLMQNTLERLAAPLLPEEATELAPILKSEQNPLVIACEVVASRMGIAIQSYPGIEKHPPKIALKNIARYSRIRIRQVALRGEWWRSTSGPLLGFFVATEQAVALLPTSNHAYELVDPVTQSRRPITAEVEAELSSFAYAFYRPFFTQAPTAREMLEFGLHDSRSSLLSVLWMGTAIGLLELLPPVAVDKIFSNIIPNADRGLLLQVGLTLLLVALVTGVFRVLRGFAVLEVQSKMDVSIQAAIWDHILNLPPAFFRKYSSGELGVRAMGITEIRRLLSGHIMNAILNSLSAMFNLVLLFVYSPELALVALCIAVGAAVVITVSGIYQLRYQREQNRVQREISGKVLQLLTGIVKLRASDSERRALAIWGERFASQRALAYKARSVSNRLLAFNAGYPTLASLLIFAVVAYAPLSDLETGAFLAFNLAFTQFLVAMLTLGAVSVSVLVIVPTFQQIRPILDAEPEVDERKAPPGELTGDIEVSHVTFRYAEDSPLVLNDISLRIRPGDFVALVGASGSGKSTLLRLLLGFDVPESGEVFYDGQALSGLDLWSIRQQIGVVLQNARIMSGDIFTNIVSSSAHLTLDDAWHAAAMAGFEEDVRPMPMGMQTIISEGGGNLSGGQRQRLLIARALANKPRILFFDEATSALDNRTQEIVSRSLENQRITRVVIAHRLSTIMNANQIHVFEHGRIVQSGTYAHMINHPGPFAELAKRQLV